ncbi:MAG: hypothetical protein JWO91_3591 [Acidobacteriaceae bacterium]|nr:hypothetical protein [Acidobacteriaceae bacterium]
MNIVKATRSFEEWLRFHTKVVERDIRLKHSLMAKSPFTFLRATFYRWVQVWPKICPELARAPHVLGVGDLHVENFGTWRDADGRLVWGINDFDEAAEYAYTIDLVRLATSALLAAADGHIALKGKAACQAILEGYENSLREHGEPFVLEERNTWLRQIATGELRDPVHFWKKMDALPTWRGDVSPSAREALEHLMPQHGLAYRVAARVAGLGSLGHVRLVAIAECHGGKVAREAKALVASSADWARGATGPPEIMYQAIISRAVRCIDPFVQLRGRWIVRRLSPHCSRIELAVLPTNGGELRLLSAMGWETANVHLGTKESISDISRHLKKMKANWLYASAKEMADMVTKDWRAWSEQISN